MLVASTLRRFGGRFCKRILIVLGEIRAVVCISFLLFACKNHAKLYFFLLFNNNFLGFRLPFVIISVFIY